MRVTHEIHPQASTERASEQVLPKHQPQLVYLLDRAAAPPARGKLRNRCQRTSDAKEPRGKETGGAPRKSAQTTNVAVNSIMSEPNGHSLARAYERKTLLGGQGSARGRVTQSESVRSSGKDLSLPEREERVSEQACDEDDDGRRGVEAKVVLGASDEGGREDLRAWQAVSV